MKTLGVVIVLCYYRL